MTEYCIENFYAYSGISHGKTLIIVANKAIERAIADGDVVPTQQVVDIMKDYKNRALGNFENEASFVTKYLEGLK